MIIEVLEDSHPDRYQAETFIHDRFDMEYNADVRNYMPHLLRLQTRDGKPVAIVGYRDAARQRLFLEHYFDEPIEDVLSCVIGQCVSRDKIVEAGNLADAQPGGARAAITALTAYLYGAGFRWVVFTGVAKLHNAFFRLGLEPLQIGVADVTRLTKDEQHQWGRYYQAGPRIMAGDIHEGYFALEFTRKILQPLWDLALNVGKEQWKKKKVA